ncbi:TolB-like protein/class 3 adenylate cyclase/Tfp pilus assembly protein PilF [Sinorhizobium kostiense]|uniref:TolB-like protein/class 3 adenylate cyclase/Tfp pilus assembly protein PilF n=1 Tax=Sinorhizobium kostiense TaxID=76747 RepID=A0ABS4R428_9HYPH|nr:tetratricopeptide repeat protein [Sinorhizobium kostiense]MBP2237074.1 TolB-like protein/class 3 adenylate cyclase/Tfp pilus assembly protein PilF [Sinorhizobium kostiense]
MRRLAAILDADVVGYSRLMGRDEAGTFNALKECRNALIRPAVAEHGGRIVKQTGDGTLAEFSSVVAAVTCAMEIQRKMLQQGGSGGAEPLQLRIGIHLGDVIVEDDDIHGDGVSLAERLQKIAPPGGVCVSQQVYDQVASKLEFPVVDLGLRAFSEIQAPVRVWQWQPAATGGPATITAVSEVRTVPDHKRPSIAVLPFVNLSSVDEQEHFSDGFTEELIATLARCRWLRVVARNSSFAYKGAAIDVRKVAEDLGVKYVIEGSIRRSGDRIRITAQLLRGETGMLLWAERYDRMLGDIFVLQDEIAGQITGTVEPELGIIEFAALRGQTAADMDAWNVYLKGLWHLYKFTLDDLKTAKGLFERAIELEPGFAQAHARLAYVHIQLGWYGPLDERADRIDDAVTLAERAIMLDSREPAAQLALGRALALRGEPERGIDHLRAALRLSASFAQGHFALGQALCYVERPEEGIAEIKEACRLSPRDPHLWTFHNMLAIAHYQSGRYAEAVAAARTSLRQENVTFWPAMVLAAALGAEGLAAEAREAVAELLRWRPDMTTSRARAEFYFGSRPAMSEAFVDRFANDLRRAGLSE